MMNFEDIQSIEDLAVVSEEVVWQNFERLGAFTFEKIIWLCRNPTFSEEK
jgi:hypothetical protein